MAMVHGHDLFAHIWQSKAKEVDHLQAFSFSEQFAAEAQLGVCLYIDACRLQWQSKEECNHEVSQKHGGRKLLWIDAVCLQTIAVTLTLAN